MKFQFQCYLYRRQLKQEPYVASIIIEFIEI